MTKLERAALGRILRCAFCWTILPGLLLLAVAGVVK